MVVKTLQIRTCLLGYRKQLRFFLAVTILCIITIYIDIKIN